MEGTVEANIFLAALAGLIGAVVMTLLIYLLKMNGKSVDIPYLIGTRFIDIENRSRAYTVGILLHLLIGAGWGVIYVFLLTAMAFVPDWPAGILWGLAHGIFVGSLMGIAADAHPYIGDDKPISSPGIMGADWGDTIPYYILGLHIIFGVCTLWIYSELVFG